VDDLIGRVLAGDRRALSRALSIVEDRRPGWTSVVKALYRRAGKARILGITGPPGAGKSTLVDRLIGEFRAAGLRVAVVAVDPSSAFSGGAILGDRIRMQERALDPGVFIRSMATRGHMGGLATATDDLVTVLDGAGFDVILVETVGVGQDEVDIVREADTVLVVLVPGMGDDIQAIKAGIMEIADIFVLNKADREGADRLEREVQSMLGLAGEPREWTPPVVKTVASRGEGLDGLLSALERHRVHLAGSRSLEERRRLKLRQKFWDQLQERFREQVRRRHLDAAAEEALSAALLERRADPYTAAEELLAAVLKEGEA